MLTRFHRDAAKACAVQGVFYASRGKVGGGRGVKGLLPSGVRPDTGGDCSDPLIHGEDGVEQGLACALRFAEYACDNRDCS